MVQGAAVVGIVLNLIALWKQEKVTPMSREERAAPRPRFRAAWADLAAGGQAGRLLAVVFLGTMAFNMQDVLLEPYGGEILGPVGLGHHDADGGLGGRRAAGLRGRGPDAGAGPLPLSHRRRWGCWPGSRPFAW